MDIEIIEPIQEIATLTREELNRHQLEAGDVFELTYLGGVKQDRLLTNVFMVADTIGASSYLVNLKTGWMTQTRTSNPLANSNLKIVAVNYFETIKLTLERGEN